VATHALLNLRTYVRHGDETGIYFISEWVPNPLSRVLGPLLYGLPYRLGRLEYGQEDGGRSVGGRVMASRDSARFSYHGKRKPAARLTVCRAGSLDEFLLERYTAFTKCGSRRRLFRVWHEPWLNVPLDLTVEEQSLIVRTHRWFGSATCVGAHFSPGVRDVWMGRARSIKSAGASRA
jgi:hypothetical protein